MPGSLFHVCASHVDAWVGMGVGSRAVLVCEINLNIGGAIISRLLYVHPSGIRGVGVCRRKTLLTVL